MTKNVRELTLTIKDSASNVKNLITKCVRNTKVFMASFIFIILVASFIIYGEDKGHDQIIRNETKKEEKEIYETYKLIWKDEFNYEKLDTTKWTAKNQNLSFESDNLVLISEKKFYDNDDWKINSGLIRSKDKFYFTYGYIEMRAKVTKGNGLLSALWLTGQNGWPPEIDIMEYLGVEPDSIYMTLHCNPNEDATCEGVYKSGEDRQLGTKYILGDWSLDYHIYSIEWTPESIIWFIDDVEVYNVTTGVPKDPMYIVLSICAHNCGDGWSERTDKTTPNPAKFYIDYVKVYTKTDISKINKDQINGEFIKIKRV